MTAPTAPAEQISDRAQAGRIASPQAGRIALTRWLVAQTRPLLAPLAIAALARIAGQLLAVSILLVAVAALLRIAAGEPSGLLALAVTIVALSLGKAGLRYLEHFVGHGVAFAALQRLRELFFARLIPQAPAATKGRASAELTERATRDIDRIEVFFAHTIPPVVASLIVPVVVVCWFAAAVSPGAAATLAATTALALAAPFLTARLTGTASRRELRARGRLARHVADDVQGIREILAFDAQGRRLEGLARRHAEVFDARRLAGRASGVRDALQEIVWGGGLLAVLLLSDSVATAMMAAAVLVGLRESGAGTVDFAATLDSSFAAASRVREVVDAPIRVPDTGRASLDLPEAPDVELDDVTFRYDGAAAPALVAATASFSGGGWHYVAGVSGSGKSTLAGLLAREHDPQTGCVRIGGAAIRDLPLDRLRRAVVVVDQRPTLFPGTIAENLRLGAPAATDEQLRNALAAVRLADGSLADGLWTPVGERGATLSGGQLQRISIARALLTRPRVLVLDEALSQLDAETARMVREGIAGHLGRSTVIEISHRADVMPDDAWTVVVDRGRVVQAGRAGRMRASGPLARLALRE